MTKQTLILGDRNTSTIAAGANQALAVTITLNQGLPFTITGFCIEFATGQQILEARIYNAYANRDIVPANTQLGTIGKLRGVNPVLPFIKVEPFTIISGQSIQLFITNPTVSAVNVRDIGFTLFGFQPA